MHWVDRGPEPDGLEAVRSKYTQGWVEWRQLGTGSRPSSRWRQFRGDLNAVFSGLCGYCEELTEGDVDHFRPVSKYPNLVYEWPNWVLACQYCNRSKSDKWPDDGYVDPCATVESERPENFFHFDTFTGDIIAKAGISPENSAKARQMIEDLKLNAPYHVDTRKERIFFVRNFLSRVAADSEEEQEFLEHITNPGFSLPSITSVILEELGYIVEY